MDRSGVLELLGDWSAGSGPLYQQLTERLRKAIAGGDLAVGERLPSERALAEDLAVSRATVVAAYEALRAERIVVSRQGSGTVVAKSNLTELARRAGDGRVPGGTAGVIFQRLLDGPSNLISLSCAAESGSGRVVEALEQVLHEDLAGLLAEDGYFPRGLPSLRSVIAERYTLAGLPTTDDEVLVTTGAHQAIVLISQLYTRKGTPIVAESPCWPGCLDVFRDVGANVISVPLDDEGMRVPEAAAAFAQHRPALVYVMPTFHNPTGTLMSATRRRRLAELAAEHDVPVIEDNAYDGYQAVTPPPPLAAFAPAGAEVLTVGSVGKQLWGGLRIGWVRGPRGIIDRLARRKVLADLGSPVLDQALAARLLPQLAQVRAERHEGLTERRELLERRLHEELPEWTWRSPDGGASLWVRIGTDARVFAQVALRHGVEVVPGASMDGTGRFDDHIRLPFTFTKDRLEMLVGRLAAAWQELRRHGPAESAPLRPIV